MLTYSQEKDKFISFRNIPYAEKPLESLRWYEAVEPQGIREDVNDGSTDHKCPQAQVGWVPFAQDFLEDFGAGILPYKWREEITPKKYKSSGPDPIPGGKPRVILWFHGSAADEE